jgi:hypothetical protein
MKEHQFTEKIREILENHFVDNHEEVLAHSPLLKYLNYKTVSATRGSKSRGSFGNIYAIYVLVEDYIEKGYFNGAYYSEYDGAIFSDLFDRQRELPFGSKLQNHALNHRLNKEFEKKFPAEDTGPIIRDVDTSRYWINENLLKVKAGGEEHDLAQAINDIIDAYIEAKTSTLENFLEACENMRGIEDEKDEKEVLEFIANLMNPKQDARLFEIATYAILKEYYHDQKIFWGFAADDLNEENLILYKTGRTNANDGGIDFVMKPLGRFFQVTETTDVKKYFLDIDKVNKYPISFVVKSKKSVETLTGDIEKTALKQFPVKKVVEKYMEAIEEIINIPSLIEKLEAIYNDNRVSDILDEIVLQSKVEFNYLKTK